MNRAIKFWFFTAGVFLSGVVVGGLAVRMIFPVVERPPDSFTPRVVQRLVNELELTEEQKEAIAPRIRQAGEELRRLRRESWRQSGAVLEAMNAAIVAELTSGQRARFEELKAAQRVRMQAVMEERRRRSEEEPGSGGVRREGPLPGMFGPSGIPRTGPGEGLPPRSKEPGPLSPPESQAAPGEP